MTTDIDYDSLLKKVARYPNVALVLQGGGALGSYQCGVYEGLHKAGIHPNWVAGISIGAINAAIIAGNSESERIDQLKGFWKTICDPSTQWMSMPVMAIRSLLAALPPGEMASTTATTLSAFAALMHGQRGFFEPRPLSPFLFSDGSDRATSFYDTTPLCSTLEQFIDFDLINSKHGVRLTVGATEVTTGNFEYFDSNKTTICPEHIIASGALPPAFPAVEINGKFYWDGGLVSNTPLEHILNEWPREDTLALQVDLWSARGHFPDSMMDVLERIKDIQYSSRTRHGTDTIAHMQKLRSAISELIDLLPDKILPDNLKEPLAPILDDRVVNIVHLIYQAKPYEEQFKDYAFGQHALKEHWCSGLQDTEHTLAREDFFEMPRRSKGYAVHDVHRIIKDTASGNI